LRDDRPGAVFELEALLVIDRDAGDVAREEVRRELDPPKRAAHRARKRLRQHCLADAGHVLDQYVTLAEQRDEGELDLVALSDDDMFDIDDDLFAEIANG